MVPLNYSARQSANKYPAYDNGPHYSTAELPYPREFQENSYQGNTHTLTCIVQLRTLDIPKILLMCSDI